MSLLDRGTEALIVYPEELYVSRDGNKLTRASKAGVPCRGSVQPLTSSEDQAVGQSTTEKYRMRLANYPTLLGTAAQVDWQGKRYAVDGRPRQYTGSRRTAHVDYVIVRQ